jgi:glutamine amidotransferase
MCRWVAYSGRPIFLDDLVRAPGNSLISQSQRAREGRTATNADGFGVGWYGERPEPGLYRDTLPAWSDENLASLSRQIRSRLFFAHVRASTGTRTTRSNCHPFAHGRWLFMHNGQVGGFPCVRRQLEALVPDALWGAREGTTDSEVLFLILLGFGLDADPKAAVRRLLDSVGRIVRDACVDEPFRMTAAFSDGETVHAIRHSTDGRAPGLYARRSAGETVLASEPLDQAGEGAWAEVPEGLGVSVGPDGAVTRFALIGDGPRSIAA